MGNRESVLDYSRYFERKLPGIWAMIGILVVVSLLLSMASVTILHFNLLYTDPTYIIVSGLIVCMLIVITPTMLTTFFVKLATRKMMIKHLLFMSFIGGMAFSVILLASSILYHFFGAAIGVIMIVVGAASIFGWWFFTERIISAGARKSALLALLQPTLFVLFYLASSSFIFSSDVPVNILLVKLYAGIFIFGLVIYAIMYVFNNPVKKTLGFNAFDFFSAVIQEWLFGINSYKPFTTNYGIPEDIPVQAITFGKKAEKAVFLVPMLHYGVMGNIGGSSFPYTIERYGNAKHRTTTFVMHTAVNEDFNPVSAGQSAKLKRALDELVKSARPKRYAMSYSVGRYGSSTVTELSFGRTSLVTFTRAPRVTEDIAPESAVLFRRMLEQGRGNVVLIDAHNSRYESASSDELDGVKFNSKCMNEYAEAIKRMKKLHSSKTVKLGVGSADLYSSLRNRRDIARGNLNVALFRLNSFSYAMLQFNANNMMPSLRRQIVDYVHGKYNIECEVYTTDTHAVNSISMNASNVLGRQTTFSDLKKKIDECMGKAIADVDEVPVSYTETQMKRFMVWGRNSRERIFAVLDSVSALARVMVPTIIIVGFLAAAWVVSII